MNNPNKKLHGYKNQTLGPSIVLLFILLGVWWSYQPGLSGSFLFDDWKNLATLGEQGTIQSMTELVTYLLSGFAGPTGRPVAMASFLIDANTWPAPAESFKKTNLLIHLLNGILLTALLFQLATAQSATYRKSAWIAVLGATIWLLHPLHVSTTLYIVQRMTLLAATFVLAGLITYIHGRNLLRCGRVIFGFIWISLGVGVFTILATLSKENGALLPLFIIVIDSLLLRSRENINESKTIAWRIWRWTFVFLPSLALLGYIATALPTLFTDNPTVRDFTPWQRLLTESRVITSYLWTIFIPQPYSSGLFNDNIPISTGIFQPVTTLLSILGLLTLVTIAIFLRRKLPIVSAAIAFFFVGHLLESTIFPLELYFEHRNYLPSMLMSLPLAWLIVMATKPQPRKRALIVFFIVSILATHTVIRANLWGRPFTQALMWAQQNPTSPRAQNYLANFWQETGNDNEAIALLMGALRHNPKDLLTRLNLTIAKCSSHFLTQSDITLLNKTIHTINTQSPVQRYQVETAIRKLNGRYCGEWSPNSYYELLYNAIQQLSESQSPIWRQMLLQLYAEAALEKQQPYEAYNALILALQIKSSWQKIISNAAILADAGHPKLALSLMDMAPRPVITEKQNFRISTLRDIWLSHIGYYDHEFKNLRNVIIQDIQDLK